jgi:uncharacterized protein (TIGR00369 family)
MSHAGSRGSGLVDYMLALQRGDAPAPPFVIAVGLVLVSIERGVAVFELEVDLARHANPMGTLHGGVLCTLADSAMGMAYASTLAEGESFTTLELKTNFLRPVWRGRLVGTGRVVQGGRTIGLTECDVVDEQGRLVARASGTCMTLRGQQSVGR